MKFSVFSLFISLGLFCTALLSAQVQRVKIEDFITGLGSKSTISKRV